MPCLNFDCITFAAYLDLVLIEQLQCTVGEQRETATKMYRLIIGEVLQKDSIDRQQMRGVCRLSTSLETEIDKNML